MVASTANGRSAGIVPDWRKLVLSEGVLAEPTPEGNRLAFWLPDEAADGFLHWERVNYLPHSEFAVAPGICAATATSIRARRPIRTSLFSKLLGRFPNKAEQGWVLPDGKPAEQCGERRSDNLLIWAEDATRSLDESWLKARWPQSKRLAKIGENLYLVSGVELPKPSSDEEHGTGCPRGAAEAMLAAARAKGDPGKVLAALADLGAVHVNDGNAQKAAEVLGEALTLAGQLGDRSREGDILGNLGFVTLGAGNPRRALELFQRCLAIARESGDRFAEKIALERMGFGFSQLGDPASAVDCFEQALSLARSLGHRKHEADLLWYLAIAAAELGQRDQAIAHAQSAIDLMKAMRNPQAEKYAEQLEKYRAGAREAGLASPGVPAFTGATYVGDSIVAGMWSSPGGAQAGQSQTEGPGLLRMALSLGRSMIKFVGSGMRVTPPHILQQRVRTCAACEHHTGLRCRLCGCFTHAKARLDHEECPIGKWPA
jgi:tetratricopeptide (TPR) repeat protein